MHLTTGILKVALTQPWKPRVERFDETIRIAFRVWPGDLDVNIHMNNSKYPVAMEVGRWAWFVRTGLMTPAVRERWAALLAAQHVIYFRPLHLFRRYTVACRLRYADHGWLYFEEKIHSEGHLSATGLFRMRIKRGPDTITPRELAGIAGYEPPRWDAPALIRSWNEVSDGLLAERREPAPPTAAPDVDD